MSSETIRLCKAIYSIYLWWHFLNSVNVTTYAYANYTMEQRNFDSNASVEDSKRLGNQTVTFLDASSTTKSLDDTTTVTTAVMMGTLTCCNAVASSKNRNTFQNKRYRSFYCLFIVAYFKLLLQRPTLWRYEDLVQPLEKAYNLKTIVRAYNVFLFLIKH